MKRIDLACGCHMGRVRTNNEDNLYFAGMILPEGNEGLPEVENTSVPLDTPITVAVFDGMGGEACGEVASFVAAETLQQILDHDPQADLEQVCQVANLRICQETKRRGLSAMGSTAVILRLAAGHAELLNIGDSKCFHIRGGEIEQISVDHTDAEFLAEIGVTNRKPQLTQNLGLDPDEVIVEPYQRILDLQIGDTFLLCSDGLTDMVSNEEIYGHVLMAHSAAEMVASLIALAMERGGRDNTTVICCQAAS